MSRRSCSQALRRAGRFLAAMVALGGCATIVNGASQNLSVVTDPAGASCIFRRDGQVIGIVNPTPGTLAIAKASAPIEVRCAKEGYAETSGQVGSHFQSATLGNILLGGLIGVVVDASSGAMSEYEPELKVTLEPLVFPTAAARDAFFEKRRRDFLDASAAAQKQITEHCRGDGCNKDLARLKQEEQAGQARIDAEYGTARIQP